MSSSLLYIACNATVAAIDPGEGREVWRTKLGTGGLFAGTTGQDVCLLEDDGRLFAGCGGHLFCLDAGTGAVLWHNDLKGLGFNDVTLAMAGKSVQYVSSHSQTHSR